MYLTLTSLQCEARSRQCLAQLQLGYQQLHHQSCQLSQPQAAHHLSFFGLFLMTMTGKYVSMQKLFFPLWDVAVAWSFKPGNHCVQLTCIPLFAGSIFFSLIASTFLLLFSNSYCLHCAASNSLCSLFLACSITLSCTRPSVSSTVPALKATPAVIWRQQLNVSSLRASISSHCSLRACSKAHSLILYSMILSIIVLATPPSKLRQLVSLPCIMASW
jgi:hypothetical protein